jgi:UPF0755 protein
MTRGGFDLFDGDPELTDTVLDPQDIVGLGTQEDGSRRSGRRRAGRGTERARVRRRRRKRVIVAAVVLVVLVGAGGAAYYGWRALSGFGSTPDYSGTGTADVIVQIADGASTSDIAATLADARVVASTKAFIRAAEAQPRVRSVQPGYYKVRTTMSGSAAVNALIDPAGRVGQLDFKGGVQLDDTTLPGGGKNPGLLSQIAHASCADLNGRSTCVSATDLRTAMATTDPAALGVPDWATGPVAAVEPNRKLEGLIVPGRYDVKPGSTAAELLTSVVRASATRLQAAGLPNSADKSGFTPYQILIIGSLVEKEGITGDFGKIARVVDNRLAKPMKLEFDSTINYPLDRQVVTTSPEDRARPGPYNLYLNLGLPPTPIGAPSTDAVTAAINPDSGGWLFFVKCQTDGMSCFANTPQEHQANVDSARARGVF